MSQPLSIAIIGGGLAGCTLANGLIGLAHIRFDVFEGKSTFSELGAGVGLAINAQNALREMGMDPDVRIRNAGGVKMGSSKCLIGQGPHMNKLMLELPGGVQIVARDLWLKELIKTLPDDRLHVNKKLETLVDLGPNNIQKRYHLHFTDGTVHTADAVIGCDGIHSKIRGIILGESHPATPPLFGGYWDSRGVITTQTAIAKLKTPLFDPSKNEEVAIVGNGCFMLFAPMSGSEEYNVIVSAKTRPDWDATAWKTDLNRDLLEQTFQDWEDAQFKDAVIDAILSQDGPKIMLSQWESPEAPTYFRDGIVMVGDSAHATTPWMGSGAGMATEDSCVLSRLLANVTSTHDIPNAFNSFDQVRRGRPEYVVRHSQKVARLLTGQEGLDPEGVKHLGAEGWWREIWGLDVKAHVEEALGIYRSM